MHFTREQRDAWMTSTRDSAFNRWLRARASDSAGRLDLQALHEVAREFGVNADAYAHLNPGQQRMNIGNRLRKLVPQSHYADAHDELPRPAPPEPEPAALHGHVSPALTQTTTSSLMRLYGSVIDELRRREVVRTGNAPLGDYTEYLFARAFGWTLANNSAAGHDATDQAGLRFQIKARRLRLGVPAERQLSIIRGLPESKFDMLAAVLFDRDFDVARAALVPHAVVVARATFVTHVNGWRLMLDDAVWDEPGVRDVTAALQAAS